MLKARQGSPDDIQNKKADALTKDFLMCAQRLGLSPHDAAQLLGVPAGAFAAMKAGKRTLDGLSGEAESADALVRITKRLHKLLGDNETAWRSWIRRECADLDGKPVDIMLQRQGALKIARYLDGKGEL